MEWKKSVEEIGSTAPILSWCKNIEDGALAQAINAANLPCLFKHVALMSDSHLGYGVPVGSVIALKNSVCPNAVGVDIGCGMEAIKTSIPVGGISNEELNKIVRIAHRKIPTGEGHSHKEEQDWFAFDEFLHVFDGGYQGAFPAWVDDHGWKLDKMNLGTLGGGNHFIEIQAGDDGYIWVMLHSGSRNMGQRIARYYHQKAIELCRKWYTNLPTEELAFLPADTEEGQAYIRDMSFALRYAQESRTRMMESMRYIMMDVIGSYHVDEIVNIHHNYASIEYHMGENVWVHRKGATSAKSGQIGIIPGACGNDSASYIVRGKGNPLSFMSCSHGAGRAMGRNQANLNLDKAECDRTMEGISFRGWQKAKSNGKKKPLNEWDLAEASGAYKNIQDVMDSQTDLVDIVVKLTPIASIKG